MQQIMRYAFGAAAIGLIVGISGVAPAAAGEFSDAEKSEIENIVREYIRNNPEVVGDYIRRNPEIVLEAVEILKAREAQREQVAVVNAVKTQRDKIERHPMTPVSGNPDGSATVVEFFDYNCPYCKRAFATMTKLQKEDPDLRIVWKEYPILGPLSRFAARAAMAADRQGKYNEFHEAAMGTSRLVSEDQILKIAAKVGLDVKRLKKDMADPAIDAYLDETIELARSLNITGTPSFVVGGAIIPGGIEEPIMKEVIEEARAGNLAPGPIDMTVLENLAVRAIRKGS